LVGKKRNFIFSTPVQTGRESLPTSYQTGTIAPFFSGAKRPGLPLTTDPDQGPILRMSGAIPLLPLYAFMACYGTFFTSLYCHTFFILLCCLVLGLHIELFPSRLTNKLLLHFLSISLVLCIIHNVLIEIIKKQ